MKRVSALFQHQKVPQTLVNQGFLIFTKKRRIFFKKGVDIPFG